MKAAMVEEKEGPRLIVGLNDVDAQVRREEELGRRLVQVQAQANVDALTGVRNKHAYLETESRMDRAIAEKTQQPFAIAIFDVNDLKKINDTSGHQEGDRCIRDASVIICNIFKHSPVFRIGGDEFAVLLEGHDYETRQDILSDINAVIESHVGHADLDHVVMSLGLADFDPEKDKSFHEVFMRADGNMYERKAQLKSMGAVTRD